MKTRTIPIFMVTAAVAAAFGMGVYIHGAGKHQEAGKSSTARHHLTTGAKEHRHAGSHAPSLIRLLPTTHHLELAWAPMDALAPTKPTHSPKSVTITRATVPQPLNLNLPAGIPQDTDPLGGPPPTTNDANTFTRSKIVDPLVLNFQPSIDTRDPGLEDNSHLFSRRSYMRGFMTQNWVTDNLGLQGGLAIKENRLRDENSDLRDNVAIGMGVLLAF